MLGAGVKLEGFAVYFKILSMDFCTFLACKNTRLEVKNRFGQFNENLASIVVEKLADVIKKMKPDEVPPIVYQVRLFDIF